MSSSGQSNRALKWAVIGGVVGSLGLAYHLRSKIYATVAQPVEKLRTSTVPASKLPEKKSRVVGCRCCYFPLGTPERIMQSVRQYGDNVSQWTVEQMHFISAQIAQLPSAQLSTDFLNLGLDMLADRFDPKNESKHTGASDDRGKAMRMSMINNLIRILVKFDEWQLLRGAHGKVSRLLLFSDPECLRLFTESTGAGEPEVRSGRQICGTLVPPSTPRKPTDTDNLTINFIDPNMLKQADPGYKFRTPLIFQSGQYNMLRLTALVLSWESMIASSSPAEVMKRFPRGSKMHYCPLMSSASNGGATGKPPVLVSFMKDCGEAKEINLEPLLKLCAENDIDIVFKNTGSQASGYVPVVWRAAVIKQLCKDLASSTSPAQSPSPSLAEAASSDSEAKQGARALMAAPKFDKDAYKRALAAATAAVDDADPSGLYGESDTELVVDDSSAGNAENKDGDSVPAVSRHPKIDWQSPDLDPELRAIYTYLQQNPAAAAQLSQLAQQPLSAEQVQQQKEQQQQQQASAAQLEKRLLQFERLVRAKPAPQASAVAEKSPEPAASSSDLEMKSPSPQQNDTVTDNTSDNVNTESSATDTTTTESVSASAVASSPPAMSPSDATASEADVESPERSTLLAPSARPLESPSAAEIASDASGDMNLDADADGASASERSVPPSPDEASPPLSSALFKDAQQHDEAKAVNGKHAHAHANGHTTSEVLDEQVVDESKELAAGDA